MRCECDAESGREEFSSLVNEAISKELKCDDKQQLSPMLKQHLLDYEWLFGKPKNIERLAKFVVIASRYDPDKSLIYAAILQAMRFGADYIIDRCSPEAEEFMARYRTVTREYVRLISHTRFQRFSKTLVAEVRTKFNIFDLLLSNFKSRYKNFKIVLLSKDKAHIANGGLYTTDRDEFLKETKIKLEHHDKIWDTYYSSQFIPNRRNRKYAMSSMPKKYSPPLEKHYIEFGVQETKLTNFIF